MYKLRCFGREICRDYNKKGVIWSAANDKEFLFGNEKNFFSIWEFPLKVQFQHILNEIQNFMEFGRRNFSFVFWYAMLVAILSLLTSLNTVYKTFFGAEEQSTIPGRRLKFISESFRRKARLVAVFLVMKINFILICGLITVSATTKIIFPFLYKFI